MRAWVVLKKEVVDGVRDYRSLLSAMGFPLLAPLLSMLLLSAMVAKMAPEEAAPDGSEPELPVVGLERAPSLMAWLDDSGLDPVPFEGTSPEEAVRQGDEKVVLRVPDDYVEDWRAGRRATVEMIYDAGRDDATSRVTKVHQSLNSWSWNVGNRRLKALGVAPEVSRPVWIKKLDLSTAEERGARGLMLIPMFIIMACFMCSMYVAIDVTAGERERGSLEALVLTTVTPQELSLAKFGAAFVFGLIGVALTAVLEFWALGFVDLEPLGLKVAAGPRELGMFILVCIPITAMAAAAQVLLATFSRSFKEAQTYLSIMVVLPMVPGFLMTMSPFDEASWMMAVPALGQQLMMENILKGEGLPALDYGLSALSSIVLTLLLVWVCGRLLRKEAIIFGR